MHCKTWPYILELAPPKTTPLPKAADFAHVMDLIGDDDPDAKIIISEEAGALICCSNEMSATCARIAADRSRIVKRG